MAKSIEAAITAPRRKRQLTARQRPIGRNALHERTAERLRVEIIHGDLAPGAALAEVALCARLGVSRTPLREALKLLAAEGLVELWPNRSARVQPLRRDETHQLFEAVSGIERIAAEYAAARMTAAEVTRLSVLQTRMERAHVARDRDLYFRLNQEIHRAIVAGAKNDVIAATHAGLLLRAERARYLALASRDRWDESVEEHRRILAALSQGDACETGRQLGEHVRRTGEVVVAALASAAARAAAEAAIDAP